ncbi:MAG: hypothetical protein DSY59_04245 [Persephonella sp.]|nr:MAG: hypothetical protein DSY59_04245 [Persephonella sp.]
MNNKAVLTSIFATFIALVVFSVLFVVGTKDINQSVDNKQATVKSSDTDTNTGINSDLPKENKINQLIGKKYLDFYGIDEDGKETSISEIIDGEPTVIIFFAIGDKPGTFDFMPHMNELYDRYKSKVNFVAVLLSRSDREEVQELKRIAPINIPVLRGYSDAIENYQISKVDVPYILFIDKNGVIKHIILRPESEMITEAPYVGHEDYKDKTQEERIESSIKEIEKYIIEIGE